MAPQELKLSYPASPEFVHLIDDKKKHPKENKAYYDLKSYIDKNNVTYYDLNGKRRQYTLTDELKAFHDIMRSGGKSEKEAGDYALMFLQRSRGTSNSETMLEILKLTRNEMAAMVKLSIAIQKKETFETGKPNEFMVKTGDREQSSKAEGYAKHFKESIAKHKENIVHYLAVSLKGGDRTMEMGKYFEKLHEVAERIFANEFGATDLMKKIKAMPGY